MPSPRLAIATESVRGGVGPRHPNPPAPLSFPRVEPSAPAAVYEHLTAEDNGATGIWIFGPIAALTDSVAIANHGDGIDLENGVGRVSGNYSALNWGRGLVAQNAGAAVIEANEVWGNSGGLLVTTGSGRAVVGNADLAAGRGNRVYDNAGTGIETSGNVLVAGNTVYSSGGWGISLNGGEASDNGVFENAGGITGSGTVTGNRVSDNAGTGVAVYYGSLVAENVISGNTVGVHGIATY